MKLRALIVDDEKPARRGIRSLLEAESDVEIVGEAATGREGVQMIESLNPNLVFLDVQMPEMDGFGTLEAVGAARMPTVIFVTAYDQFALRAFEAQALDYLLKPFDETRFHRALNRARARIQLQREQDLDERLETLLGELQKPKYLDRVAIRSGARTVFLRTAEIDWIESEANYLRLHVGKKSYLLRESVSGLAAKLDPECFAQIHRATIINIDRIQELQSLSPSECVVVLHDGTRLPASRGFREHLRTRLGVV